MRSYGPLISLNNFIPMEKYEVSKNPTEEEVRKDLRAGRGKPKGSSQCQFGGLLRLAGEADTIGSSLATSTRKASLQITAACLKIK